ncbi:MAG: DUF6282 family protein [Methanobacteriaceae archaeon]|nr:DUF6282 family protein [Methanobacteriaceae archaeon]
MKILKEPWLQEKLIKINETVNLKGFVDIHLHTSPDVKPRICNDLEAAQQASDQGMQAVVIKSHAEPTSARAKIAEDISSMDVFGGVCLNNSVGGLNPLAVDAAAKMGGKFVWLPTISFSDMEIDFKEGIYKKALEEILQIISQNDMVLATGHLKPHIIFSILDDARSHGVKRIVINHPLTSVVGATIDEQKEMARYAFLEHCFVACMPLHDYLSPDKVAEAIEGTGYKRCIMATDFGQKHNPYPINGFKLFINSMMERGVTQKQINTMCSKNPKDLLY